MVFLLLSILCSTMVVSLFQLFTRFGIRTFQAIVFNYVTCAILGFLLHKSTAYPVEVVDQAWFPWAIFLGTLFISGFYIIGISVQKIGITVTSIAARLSLIMPVTVAFIWYGDAVYPLKIFGIILAIVAVVLSSLPDQKVSQDIDPKLTFLPFGVWLVSALIETIIKYNQEFLLQDYEFNLFLVLLFGSAAIYGFVVLWYRNRFMGDRLEFRSAMGGLLFGIPNYGSIFFLIKVLDQPGWDSSVIFPLNNIGVLLGASITATIFFNERLNKLNYAGLFIALISIIFITIREW